MSTCISVVSIMPTATSDCAAAAAPSAPVVRPPVPRRTVIATVSAHELRSALRGRMVPVFSALFTLLTVGIALAGLGASGVLVVQGFTRTAVSLLTLSLYLLPLLGLLLGAASFSGDDGSTEMLLAQPITRADVLLGRLLGLYTSLLIIAAAGFGLSGLMVLATTGMRGIGDFLGVAAGATAVGGVGLGAGVLIGVLARNRSTATGWALGVWFAAVVLYDLAAIALLQLTGTGDPGPVLVAILAFNPIDGVRAAALISLGADVLLGPTGAALELLFGRGGGTMYVLAALSLWIVLPPAVAALVYERRDF